MTTEKQAEGLLGAKTQVTHPYDIGKVGMLGHSTHATSTNPYFPQVQNPFGDLDFGVSDEPDPFAELGLNTNPKKLAKQLLKPEVDPE